MVASWLKLFSRPNGFVLVGGGHIGLQMQHLAGQNWGGLSTARWLESE
jgi:hypothetical protein